MLIFNQQANIKNVNGAIADTLANRPAAQSTFYIFYAIDTQEIYYDNGTWVLIGTGGGGQNIYNSDGTLTSNRTLNGDNKDLIFNNLNRFQLTTGLGAFVIAKSVFPNVTTIQTSNSGTQLTLNSFNQINSTLNTTFFVNQSLIETIYGGNDIGLKLDFANQSYSLGDPGSFAGGNYFVIDDANGRITTGNNTGINGVDIDFNSGFATFGFITTANSNNIVIDDVGKIKTTFQGVTYGIDIDASIQQYNFGQLVGGNRTYFSIDDVTSIIKTSYQNNDIGLKLNFANNQYLLGDENFVNGFGFIRLINNNNFANNQIEINTSQYAAGDLFSSGNETTFLVDDSSQLIKTTNQGNDIGLRLDFANGIYYLGDDNPTFAVKVNTGFGTQQITLGDYGGDFNGTSIELNDTNQIIQTTNQGNFIGLKLDFANNIYSLGTDATGYGLSGFWLDWNNCNNYIGDGANNYDGVNLQVYNNPKIIKTQYRLNDIGLKLDFANTLYTFGQLIGGNESIFIVDDSNELIYTTFGGNSNGIAIDLASNSFIFGRITGSNTTNLTINDGATYPVEINGTNVLSGTSGGSSGQHLKIKINGVDYKIRLENP